jgi:hypothetical protein
MERFEEFLREQGITLVGQAATGSGNMLRMRLRLTNGEEVELALDAEVLLERPEEAIRLVEDLIRERERPGHPSSNGRAVS